MSVTWPRLWKSKYLFLFAITAGIAMGCAARQKTAPPAGKLPETQPVKVVIGAQAFLDADTERQIIELWQRAMKIPGVKCAYATGALPHVTVGAWKIAREDWTEAQTKLDAASTRLAPLTVTLSLEEERERDGRISYYLIPGKSPELLGFYRQVQRLLNYPYEGFQGRNTEETWRPHLTLFTVPANKVEECKPVLDALARIREARLTRLGLVLYVAPSWQTHITPLTGK